MNRLPLTYRIIQGAIGKRFVIKHYKYGVIKTRYPNMQNIVPSESQKKTRRLFRLAVRYAKCIYADPIRKEEKRRMMRRPKRLFQALMKEWFRKRAERSFWNQRRLQQWKSNVEIDHPTLQSLLLNGGNIYAIVTNRKMVTLLE